MRLSKNRNTITQNVKDTVEAVIKEKVKCLYQKRRKIPNLFYNSEFLENKKHLSLKWEKKNNKITAEINEMRNKERQQKRSIKLWILKIDTKSTKLSINNQEKGEKRLKK